MATVNEQIRDRSITRRVYLEGLTVREAKKIQRVTDKAGKEILNRIKSDGMPKTVAAQHAQVRAFKKISDEAMNKVVGKLDNDVVNLAIAESKYQADLLKKSMPIIWDTNTPAPTQILGAVRAKPYGGKILKDWYKNAKGKAFSDLKSDLSSGYLQGLTTPQLISKLHKSSLAKTRAGTAAMVRTALTHTASVSRDITYIENADIISAVQWLSTLDTRTSEYCIGLDGKVFVLNDGPRPPAHVNCRSTTIPITKSWKQLGLPFKDLKPQQRASMDGQVAARTTYPEWLKKQSLSRQREVLGERGAELFAEGKLNIGKFEPWMTKYARGKGDPDWIWKSKTKGAITPIDITKVKVELPPVIQPPAPKPVVSPTIVKKPVTLAALEKPEDVPDFLYDSMLYHKKKFTAAEYPKVKKGIEDKFKTLNDYRSKDQLSKETGSYYSGQYTTLNKKVRSGDALDADDVDKLIRIGDDLQPLKESHIAFRGLQYSKEIKVGEEWVENGITSWSKDYLRGSQFAGGAPGGEKTLLVVRMPKGLKAIVENAPESEIITLPNVKFKVGKIINKPEVPFFDDVKWPIDRMVILDVVDPKTVLKSITKPSIKVPPKHIVKPKPKAPPAPKPVVKPPAPKAPPKPAPTPKPAPPPPKPIVKPPPPKSTPPVTIKKAQKEYDDLLELQKPNQLNITKNEDLPDFLRNTQLTEIKATDPFSISAEIEKKYTKVFKNLPDYQDYSKLSSGMQGYYNLDYKFFNQNLRSGVLKDKGDIKQFNKIRGDMKILKEDHVVFRGMGHKGGVKVGDEWVEDGVTSWSKDYHTSIEFSYDAIKGERTIVTVKMPKGLRAVLENAEEFELTTLPDVKYKIAKIIDKPKISTWNPKYNYQVDRLVVLDVVDPEAAIKLAAAKKRLDDAKKIAAAKVKPPPKPAPAPKPVVKPPEPVVKAPPPKPAPAPKPVVKAPRHLPSRQNQLKPPPKPAPAPKPVVKPPEPVVKAPPKPAPAPKPVVKPPEPVVKPPAPKAPPKPAPAPKPVVKPPEPVVKAPPPKPAPAPKPVVKAPPKPAPAPKPVVKPPPKPVVSDPIDWYQVPTKPKAPPKPLGSGKGSSDDLLINQQFAKEEYDNLLALQKTNQLNINNNDDIPDFFRSTHLSDVKTTEPFRISGEIEEKYVKAFRILPDHRDKSNLNFGMKEYYEYEYEDLNYALRAGTDLDKDGLKIFRDINKDMRQLKEDHVVFRGLGYHKKDMKIGDDWVEDGVTSWSKDYHTGINFTKKYTEGDRTLVTVKMPKGLRAVLENDTEFELTTLPDVKYKIAKIIDKPKISTTKHQIDRLVVLDVVDPEAVAKLAAAKKRLDVAENKLKSIATKTDKPQDVIKAPPPPKPVVKPPPPKPAPPPPKPIVKPPPPKPAPPPKPVVKPPPKPAPTPKPPPKPAHAPKPEPPAPKITAPPKPVVKPPTPKPAPKPEPPPPAPKPVVKPPKPKPPTPKTTPPKSAQKSLKDYDEKELFNLAQESKGKTQIGWDSRDLEYEKLPEFKKHEDLNYGIKKYFTAVFENINDHIRKGGILDIDNQKMFNRIMNDINDEMKPLKSNHTVFRGLNYGKEIKVGEEWVEDGITSWSKNYNVSANYMLYSKDRYSEIHNKGRKVMLMVQMPKGVRAVVANSTKSEITVLPNVQYRVVKVIDKPDLPEWQNYASWPGRLTKQNPDKLVILEVVNPGLEKVAPILKSTPDIPDWVKNPKSYEKSASNKYLAKMLKGEDDLPTQPAAVKTKALHKRSDDDIPDIYKYTDEAQVSLSATLKKIDAIKDAPDNVAELSALKKELSEASERLKMHMDSVKNTKIARVTSDEVDDFLTKESLEVPKFERLEDYRSTNMLKESTRDYFGTSSWDINYYLRRGLPPKGNLKTIVKSVESDVKPLKQSHVVFRGVKDLPDDLKIGDEWIEDGITSWSKHRSIPETYGVSSHKFGTRKDYLVVTRLPEKLKAIVDHLADREIVTLPNVRYKIAKIMDAPPGVTKMDKIVFLDVVDPDAVLNAAQLRKIITDATAKADKLLQKDH